MKAVLGKMAGAIFGLFSIGVIGLIISLTYGALQRIFPNDPQNQMWGLVIYDIATLAWGLAFVYQSKTVGQYAAAALGFLVGLLGTLGMIAAEVTLSGQQLTGAIDTSQIGRNMVYAFIICSALHIILIYSHHGADPETTQKISTGVARGQIMDHAMRDAERQLEMERAALARDITADIVAGVRRDLLIPVQGTPFDPNREYTLNTPRPPYILEEPPTRQDYPDHAAQDATAAKEADHKSSPFPGQPPE